METVSPVAQEAASPWVSPPPLAGNWRASLGNDPIHRDQHRAKRLVTDCINGSSDIASNVVAYCA